MTFWTPEKNKRLLELRKDNKSYKEIKKMLKYPLKSDTLKVRVHKLLHNKLLGGEHHPKKKLEFKRISINEAEAIGTNVSRPYSDKEMFDLFDIDPTVWTITKKIINTWATFFQTKLWLARNKGVFEFRTIQDEFKKWIKINAPKTPKISYSFTKEVKQRLLEINIADPHFDKLSWGKESIDNYDSKIARAVFIDALIQIIDRAKVIGFSKILLVLGNDLFNSEGKRGTTTSGTPQDSDVRWKKSFSFVIGVLKESIEICKKHAPVDVLFVLGNHDEERTYYAGEAINGLFLNDSSVLIDNNPKSRKYYKWGKNMIQFAHGYMAKTTLKNEKIPALMAQEEPEMWAATDYRYSHQGHWHHNDMTIRNMLKDQIGVTIQIMPSIAGTDGWHYDNGYIGANKQAKGFIYDKKLGQIFEINYYAPRYFYLD